MTTLMLIIAGAIVTPFVLGPVLIYFVQRFRIPANIIRIDPKLDPLPPEAIEHFRRSHDLLAANGFQYVGTFGLLDLVPNVQCVLAMYVNRIANDQAMTSMLVGGQGQAQVTNKYVEFVTRFEDGTIVQTSNTNQLGAFKPQPKEHTVRFEEISDVGRLFQYHTALKNHYGPGKRAVLRLDRDCHGDAQAYLAEIVLSETFGDQVATGYLRRSPEGFRPTVFGAWIMTWQELPPWKQLRQMRSRRQAKRLIHLLGLRLSDKIQ